MRARTKTNNYLNKRILKIFDVKTFVYKFFFFFIFHDHRLINFSTFRFVCFNQSHCCKIAKCSNI